MPVITLQNVRSFMQDVPAMAKRFHVTEDDYEDFEEIFEKCMELAQPKMLCKKVCVSPVRNDANMQVLLDDETFESHILYLNMLPVKEVYAYVGTCGRELYNYAVSAGDPLERFWIDSVSEACLAAVVKYGRGQLEEESNEKLNGRMNPGSLPDWPISQQKPLFHLLNDVYGEIGVELTDTFLMLPYKSGSGILYHSDEPFVSCTYCKRTECSGRRAPFDAKKYEEKFGK